MSSSYPEQGSSPWDDDLKAYIDEGDAAATAAAESAAAADMGGWPTYVYGNSYGVLAAGWFTPGNHYAEQVAEALNGGSVASYAVGGRRIIDVNSTLINGVAFPGTNGVIPAGEWVSTSARSGLVVLESIINDTAHYPDMSVPVAVPAKITLANTRYLEGMRSQYRTALALMSSESRVDDVAGVTAGAWTKTFAADTSEGTIGFTSAVGASMTYTVTPPQSGPLAGKVFGLAYSLDPSIGAVAATINVSVDGGAAVPFTVHPWEQYTGHAGTGVYQIPIAIPVTVPIDGATHTVSFTHAGAAGAFMYSDAVIIPSSQPNPIAVMGNEFVPNVGAFDAAGISAYRFNVPMVNAVVKSVVAEFGNAFYVPGTHTSNGLYSGDGLHPNDRGMTQRAGDLRSAIEQAIRARLNSRVQALRPDGDFGII